MPETERDARPASPAVESPPMRAILFDAFGGPDVLYEGTLPRPVPGPGEVLIEVAYAGVNPAEWKIREGYLKDYFTPDFPFVPGFDASGVVAAAGPGVTLRPGTRVVAATNQGLGQRGSYAEYVLAAAERTVPLPDGIALADAATLPTAGMTAFEAVHDVGDVTHGMTVLVHGGAGGVGSFAVQLARAAGATVAATASTRNIPYLRALGVRFPIDYTKEDVASAVYAFASEGVDLLIDTVGQGTLPQPVALVRPGGRYAPIATAVPGATFPESARDVAVTPVMSTYPNQGRQLRSLVEALEARCIRAPDTTILPLAEAAEAQRRSRVGHVHGKLLLAVAPNLGKV